MKNLLSILTVLMFFSCTQENILEEKNLRKREWQLDSK